MGKFNGAETKVMNGRVLQRLRSALPKLQSIIDFLSLNLNDL